MRSEDGADEYADPSIASIADGGINGSVSTAALDRRRVRVGQVARLRGEQVDARPDLTQVEVEVVDDLRRGHVEPVDVAETAVPDRTSEHDDRLVHDAIAGLPGRPG